MAALALAALVLGRLPGIVLGLTALLLVLDRVVGFSPWAPRRPTAGSRSS